MERYKKIVVLIPTYNEGENIVRLLHKIKKKYKTIVVDDGSKDKTNQRVKKLCTHYLRNFQNKGYQKTIERGIKFAIKKNYDGVITFDADEQFSVTNLKKFYVNLKKGFDLVIGIRNFTPRISEKIFNIYTKNKFNVEDILCGLKGYNLKSMNNKALNQKFYACPNIALDYIKRKKKMKKIFIKVKKRKGASKFGNTFFGNIKIINDLLREIQS